MKSPLTGKEMMLVKESRTLRFRKKQFEVIYHSFRCEDTGEQFTTTALDELNFIQLYNQYRNRFNIPFPDKIRELRETYGVSSTKMSSILGFGVNSYRNYENGEVPNLSNAKLIQLIENPGRFKELVESYAQTSAKDLSKLVATIDAIINANSVKKFDYQLKDYFMGPNAPNPYSGYVSPNLEKFSQMVAFFAKKMEPLKTKLNKLLFYADFLHYKITGFSISGMKYRAITWGPVPDNFDGIFDYLARTHKIHLEYEDYGDGTVGEKFKAVPENTDEAIFEKSESDVLNTVADFFQDFSTSDIIHISHKEKAWLENKGERKIINYKYGFELNLFE